MGQQRNVVALGAANDWLRDARTEIKLVPVIFLIAFQPWITVRLPFPGGEILHEAETEHAPGKCATELIVLRV